MKHPTGYAKPRRRIAPQKQVRLNLRRSVPPPDDELGTKRKSHFWRWVALVALLHLVLIGVVYLIYEASPTPPTPEQFISLLPPGEVTKGTPGTQQAPKIGPSTPAPSVHHTKPAPKPEPPVKPVTPPTPTAVQPPVPTPKPVPPKPVVKTETPPIMADKPAPPQPPKVKVDLSQLVDGP